MTSKRDSIDLSNLVRLWERSKEVIDAIEDEVLGTNSAEFLSDIKKFLKEAINSADHLLDDHFNPSIRLDDEGYTVVGSLRYKGLLTQQEIDDMDNFGVF